MVERRAIEQPKKLMQMARDRREKAKEEKNPDKFRLHMMLAASLSYQAFAELSTTDIEARARVGLRAVRDSHEAEDSSGAIKMGGIILDVLDGKEVDRGIVRKIEALVTFHELVDAEAV